MSDRQSSSTALVQTFRSLTPDIPLNSRAGWGFMVLTNMLPNQGNGTYSSRCTPRTARRVSRCSDAIDHVRQRARDQAVRHDRYARAGRRRLGRQLRELRVGVDAAAQNHPDRRIDDHGPRGRRCPRHGRLQPRTAGHRVACFRVSATPLEPTARLDSARSTRRHCQRAAHHLLGGGRRSRCHRRDRQSILQGVEWFQCGDCRDRSIE